MNIRLAIAVGSARPILFEHAGPVIRIGRDPGCELSLQDEAGDKVSRQHARIELSATGATIADSGSSNGTLLNGRLLEGCAPLRLGDCIQMGYTGAALTVSALDLSAPPTVDDVPMPLAATSAAFVTILRRYYLLEPAQLEEAEHTLAARFLEPKALARELLQRGWLTAYQVNQIARNQAADLRLGNYVLLERLGEGGMGAVLKARHDKMGRVVALKVIRKERLDGPQAVQRFQREVRTAAQLNHPNIVQAHDADEANGTHFLAMEFVAGKDLAQVVKERGPLPVAEACAYIGQAALGLQHAHERGVVHRDIKPANLLLSAPLSPAAGGESGRGVVKILDMGIARMTADNATALTQDGAIVGSPDYIAPEQVLDAHRVDSRADLYSLGCTLYYLLTGQVPFPDARGMAKLRKHQFEEPAPLEQLRPDVSPEVTALVRRLMAKRPADRYQTAADLVAALAAVPSLDRPGAQGSALDTCERWARIVDPANTVDYVPPQHELTRRRRLLLAFGGALVIGLVLLAFWFVRDR